MLPFKMLLALKETVGTYPQVPATHFGQGGAEAVALPSGERTSINKDDDIEEVKGSEVDLDLEELKRSMDKL